MLKKCANPSCSNTFKHLREGKLLRVNELLRVKATVSPGHKKRKAPAFARSAEYYWLCGLCSSILNLALDQNSGILLIPVQGVTVSRQPSTRPPAREATLQSQPTTNQHVPNSIPEGVPLD